MFTRRVLLLAVLIAIGFAALGVRLVNLTLAQGADLRAKAEERLVTRRWTMAVRGKILDRKDRVLAQDRPGFDAAIDYDVLSGDWARLTANKAARRLLKNDWPEMSREQRRAATERLVPAYQSHLDAAWGVLARAAGLQKSEIQQRHAKIVADIDALARAIVQKRLDEGYDRLAALDDEVTADMVKAVDQSALRPIKEMQEAHVIVPRMPDEIGFAVQVLAGDEVELVVGTDAAGLPLMDRVPAVPGLKVIDAGAREYPYDEMTVAIDRATLPGPLKGKGDKTISVYGPAIHVLGWMRDRVYKEDAQQRLDRLRTDSSFRQRVMTIDGIDRGEYRDPDRVGHAGVEASREDELRGLRGLRTRQLDTGEVSVMPATPGRDVRLTVDIQLQARVLAVMSPEAGLAVVQPWHEIEKTIGADGQPIKHPLKLGQPINGAAVVLDVDSGDVLAMVSTPSFSHDDIRARAEEILGDAVNTPYVNRCINRSYPPGSIAKALILAGATSRGNYDISQRIACTGHLIPNEPNKYRCWIFKRFGRTHSDYLGHDLDAAEAIMVSCNIFFFTLGRRLGPEGMTHVYQQFGVTHKWNLGIGPEYAGVIGSKNDGSDLNIADATQMGIGQGPVAWTPLHAADAYATIARGGTKITPRIISGAARPEPSDLGLNTAGLSEVLRGLGSSVMDERGTGNHIQFNGRNEPVFNQPDIWVWGKTGTAAAPRLRVKSEDLEPEDLDDRSLRGQVPEKSANGGPEMVTVAEGDHSWYVILVGRKGDRPRYAVAVITEYAGSGGKVSGPIANQVVHALIAEGYL